MKHRVAQRTGGIGGGAAQYRLGTVEQVAAVSGGDLDEGERTLRELARQLS